MCINSLIHCLCNWNWHRKDKDKKNCVNCDISTAPLPIWDVLLWNTVYYYDIYFTATQKAHKSLTNFSINLYGQNVFMNFFSMFCIDSFSLN